MKKVSASVALSALISIVDIASSFAGPGVCTLCGGRPAPAAEMGASVVGMAMAMAAVAYLRRRRKGD
jgi:hypothetical protein